MSKTIAPGGIRCYVAGVFNKGRNGDGIEPREAFPDAGDRMVKGGLGSAERDCQKLISVVADTATEFFNRNQLIKCELLTMKNGEM